LFLTPFDPSQVVLEVIHLQTRVATLKREQSMRSWSTVTAEIMTAVTTIDPICNPRINHWEQAGKEKSRVGKRGGNHIGTKPTGPDQNIRVRSFWIEAKVYDGPFEHDRPDRLKRRVLAWQA
jgi:hypothetical protein